MVQSTTNALRYLHLVILVVTVMSEATVIRQLETQEEQQGKQEVSVKKGRKKQEE
jgi:hypothetical protein